MATQRRPYEELQAPIERSGGSMIHVKKGYLWGAWEVTLAGKKRTFRSNGRGYPDLDKLYKPKPEVQNPQHYTDYSDELVTGAIATLIGMLK